LYYFVAVNPYRDLDPKQDEGEEALGVVKDAILNHGAKGVKVYPPSGYRPAGNAIKGRPWAISSYPGKQWDARYERFGKKRNDSLDRELNNFLQWCTSNDVPVLVHSGYGEFEARKGYGEFHSNPEFWERFLQLNSKPGKPFKLRLCLGHAGGEDFWFGTGSRAEWGRRVYKICTEYPNVYCEVTTSDALIEPTRQAYLFAQSAHSVYPLAMKSIYGTDWPLPDKGEPGAVLEATQRAFLHPSLVSYYSDYFFGNATRFLKFAPGEIPTN
jgi:predicted TIM-barrel fold metal-dependent hydrolase